MGAGQRPAAHLPVERHPLGGHHLDLGGAFPVLQLAGVEVALDVVDAGHPLPAEEDVAAGLHQVLTGHDPLAVIRVAALADVLLHHRGLRLLHLHEQGILPVQPEEERDPRAGADAAHPDHLARQVHEPILLQQYAPVGLQRLSIAAHEVVHRLRHLVRSRVREELFDGHDERWVADDPWLAVDEVGELGEGLHAVARAGLGQPLLGALDHLRFDLSTELVQQLLDVQPRIPHRQIGHRREAPHRLAVTAHRVPHDLASLLGRIAVPTSGDHQARHEALDIPLPRPRQRLVEIVHVEHQPALHRSEHAEVRQMRITTHLHPKPRTGRRRKIGRHDQRSTAIERERRDQHPPVADRHQLGNPRLRLLLQQRDRIRAMRHRLETGMAGARHLRPGRAPPRHPLRNAQMGHLARCLPPRARALCRRGLLLAHSHCLP